jgi:hypothetical protein
VIPLHRRRGVRRAVLGAAAVLFAVVACAELGTGIDDISYMEFDGVPYPSLIAGDSMRDDLGAVAPFTARVYDASGAEIVGAPFTFVSLDTGVVIDAGGILRASTRRDGDVRIVATYAGVQSQDRTVRVTRRPDAVRRETAESLAVAYSTPDSASVNLAAEMRVRVLTGDSLDLGPNVGGWLVRWRIVHAGDTIAAADTNWVVLQTTTGARTALDTTDTDGTSSRRLRIFSTRIPTPTDSFVVLAEVRRHATPLAGSPVRFVIHVAPRP